LRSVKQELDIDDATGEVAWVVHFREGEGTYCTLAYRTMDTAREAARRWIVGTANVFEDLTEVDRFKNDVIVYNEV
jgi:hypothetical protein